MTLEIRKAQLEEAREIVEVHVQTWKSSYRGLIADAILDERSASAERILKMSNAIAKGLVWVAAEHDKIVGFAGLDEKSEANLSEIAVFYVLPACQGHGIGSLLLKNIIDELKKQNCKKLVIWTMQNAPSIKFYHKNGGNLTGKIKPWKYDVNVVELEWRLMA